MKVFVREVGTRPVLTTVGRANARNGSKVIADMLAPYDFADICIVEIDYDGDGITPVLRIVAAKWVKGKMLSVDWVMNLEDAFGADNFNNAVAIEIVQALRMEMQTALEEGPPSGNS